MTINKKTWEQVNKELREDFPESAFKYSEEMNLTFLKAEEVMARMDSVLGANYSVDYDSCIDCLPDVQGEVSPFVRIKCTICIYDDDGRLVTTRVRWSGDRITRLSKGEKAGSISNYGNDLDGCCSDAFKRTARTLGVTSSKVGKGNRLQNNNAGRSASGTISGKGSHQQNANTGSSPAVDTQPTENFNITFLSEFSARGNTGGYAAKISSGEEEMELMVWANASEPMVAFFGNDWPQYHFSGKNSTVKGHTQTYHGKKQLVFAGFVGKNG